MLLENYPFLIFLAYLAMQNARLHSENIYWRFGVALALALGSPKLLLITFINAHEQPFEPIFVAPSHLNLKTYFWPPYS